MDPRTMLMYLFITCISLAILLVFANFITYEQVDFIYTIRIALLCILLIFGFFLILNYLNYRHDTSGREQNKYR
jgi:glucan phosphoethanolaminetransferase (alkaline phosphatase superfamily)